MVYNHILSDYTPANAQTQMMLWKASPALPTKPDGTESDLGGARHAGRAVLKGPPRKVEGAKDKCLQLDLGPALCSLSFRA